MESTCILLRSLHKHQKEDVLKTGVYTITSRRKKKIYVGSTTAKTGFTGRWYTHVFELMHNKHSNKRLQNHVNKYGIADLRFEILDFYIPEFCLSFERYWINQLDSVKSGFNLCYPDMTTRFGRNSPNALKLDEELIVDLYVLAKLSTVKIAKIFEVCETPIERVLRDNNIKLTNHLKIANYSKEAIYTLYKRYLNGESISVLSKECKVSMATCYKLFKKNDLKVFNNKKHEKTEVRENFCTGC